MPTLGEPGLPEPPVLGRRGFDNFALSYRVTLRYMSAVGHGQDFDESVVLRMAPCEVLQGQIPLGR